MRIIKISLGVAVLGLMAAGCASSEFGQPATLASLQESCQNRGGELVRSGQQTGEVWRDTQCTAVEQARVSSSGYQRAMRGNYAVDLTLSGRSH